MRVWSQDKKKKQKNGIDWSPRLVVPKLLCGPVKNNLTKKHNYLWNFWWFSSIFTGSDTAACSCQKMRTIVSSILLGRAGQRRASMTKSKFRCVYFWSPPQVKKKNLWFPWFWKCYGYSWSVMLLKFQYSIYVSMATHNPWPGNLRHGAKDYTKCSRSSKLALKMSLCCLGDFLNWNFEFFISMNSWQHFHWGEPKVPIDQNHINRKTCRPISFLFLKPKIIEIVRTEIF